MLEHPTLALDIDGAPVLPPFCFSFTSSHLQKLPSEALEPDFAIVPKHLSFFFPRIHNL